MNIEIKPDYAMDSAVDQGEKRIVIDNGSDTIKIGLSGEDWPKFISPSVIGVEQIKSEVSQINNKNQIHFGNSIYKEGVQQNNTQVIYPIQRGQVVNRAANTSNSNPNYMVKYWCELIEHNLNYDLTQANLLIVDSPFNTKEYKKELADIFFEEVKVQSLIFMNSSVLSLFATGRTRGLVVESGYGFTSTVPVFEGYALEHALNHSFISGEDIDTQLRNILLKKYPGSAKDLNRREIIKDIKEKILSLAENYDKAITGHDTASEEERSYELPDSNIIELDNKSRYPLTEILYKPALIDKAYMGLHEMAWDSYRKCDPDLQIDLHKNIVVAGGTSMMTGFVERLAREMDKKFPYDVSRSDINYVSEGNRNYAAWIGGSMLSSLSVFQDMAIKKSEYEENSDLKLSVIHKKTF